MSGKKPAPDQKVLDQMKTLSAQMDRILGLYEDSGDWYRGVAHAQSYMAEAVTEIEIAGQSAAAEPLDTSMADMLDDDEENQDNWEF